MLNTVKNTVTQCESSSNIKPRITMLNYFLYETVNPEERTCSPCPHYKSTNGGAEKPYFDGAGSRSRGSRAWMSLRNLIQPKKR